MKKTLFLVAIASIFGFQFSVSEAQDTLTALPQCVPDDWPYGYELWDRMWTFDHTHLKFARKFDVKGAQIVGIAAFADTPLRYNRRYYATQPNAWNNLCSHTYDTTYNNCYDYFQLFVRHKDVFSMPEPFITTCRDTLEVIASKKMHILDTNVIGYFDRLAYLEQPEYRERYMPIRAVYFDSAITINGEFWVGADVHNTHKDYTDSTGHYWHDYTWSIDYSAFWNPCEYGATDCFYDTILSSSYVAHLGMVVWGYGVWNYYRAIFPLFCELPVYPSPNVLDSAGFSTVDVAPVLSASDFVTLSPNPAITEVSVLSSTGMGRLMVYDISGRKVYEATGNGPQATIPVANWPAGIYTVHVETPLGLAVKKLEKVR